MYIIINDIVSIDFSHHLQPSSSITRGHIQRFIPRVNSYHHSFLPYASLPIEVATMNNVDDNYYAHAHIYTVLSALKN